MNQTYALPMAIELHQLRALAAVVEQGTFDRAAQVLHVTPSAVSQRIRALESAAGSVLVLRSKPVTVTPAGESLLALARQIDQLTADALGRVGAGRAALPIAVNADSLATWVLPSVAEVAARTGIALEFHRADQDETVDLLRSGTVVAAVTSDPHPVPGCRSTPLGSMTYRPCATEAFVATHFPDGPVPAAWSTAPVVDFDRSDRLQQRILDQVGADASPPRHQVPGSHDYVTAVRLGLGWGMVPDLQRNGSDGLVVLDPTLAVPVDLHWQQWRLAGGSLTTIAEAIRTGAGTLLDQ